MVCARAQAALALMQFASSDQPLTYGMDAQQESPSHFTTCTENPHHGFSSPGADSTACALMPATSTSVFCCPPPPAIPATWCSQDDSDGGEGFVADTPTVAVPLDMRSGRMGFCACAACGCGSPSGASTVPAELGKESEACAARILDLGRGTILWSTSTSSSVVPMSCATCRRFMSRSRDPKGRDARSDVLPFHQS